MSNQPPTPPNLKEVDCCATCDLRSEEHMIPGLVQCGKHGGNVAVWMVCDDYKYDGMGNEL